VVMLSSALLGPDHQRLRYPHIDLLWPTAPALHASPVAAVRHAAIAGRLMLRRREA
jgi:hypothetical protein